MRTHVAKMAELPEESTEIEVDGETEYNQSD